MGKYPFNVRVYILLFHFESQYILIAEEFIKGRLIIKFPGGGLEFGEGPLDCALREAREELGIDIELVEHFYTTDFFIRSAFDPENQVISIYYKASVPKNIQNDDWLKSPDVDHRCLETGEIFKWVKCSDLTPDLLTFPGDQEVAKRLRI